MGSMVLAWSLSGCLMEALGTVMPKFPALLFVVCFALPHFLFFPVGALSVGCSRIG